MMWNDRMLNDPCPKCGRREEPRVDWHQSQPLAVTVLRNGRIDPEEEHLHYSCRVCGFDWTGPTWREYDPTVPIGIHDPASAPVTFTWTKLGWMQVRS